MAKANLPSLSDTATLLILRLEPRIVHHDANLLFGVLAVQVRMISAADLIDAAGAWATDPSRDLPDRLIDAGALTLENRAVLDGLVKGAIEAHKGNPAATLATFGGMDAVRMTMGDAVAENSVAFTATASDLPVTRVATPLGDDSVPGVTEFPGRYTRQSEHARGGMGRVLLVHDEHLSRDVALKELLPKLVGGSDDDKPTPVRLSMPFVARFLQEARITSQLEHPAIVPVYELGHRADGTLYYTMKLVRGRSLEQAIKEAGSLRDRLKFLPHVVDLCQAMAYAHSRGVIHRDIKPANVMVGEFGETVVLDWGIAKAKGQEDVHEEGLRETLRALSLGEEAAINKTAYGHALGTPAYMPPEQAKGQLEEIDERSDVYSLGVVLYELLTGDVPFKGDTLQEFLGKVIRGDATPIKDFEPDAPPELVAICEKAMRVDKGRRYQSANELANEIESFQSGSLVAAYAYSAREVIGRYVRRRKSLVATVVLAGVVLIFVSGAYVVSLNQANIALDHSNSETELEKQAAEDALDELTLSFSTTSRMVDEIVRNIDGTDDSGQNENRMIKLLADVLKVKFHVVVRLKSSGVVGESNRGYLSVINMTEVNDEDRKAIDTENHYRRLLYLNVFINNRDSKSFDEVTRIYANKRAERAKPGDMIQLPSSLDELNDLMQTIGIEDSKDGLLPDQWVLIREEGVVPIADASTRPSQ